MMNESEKCPVCDAPDVKSAGNIKPWGELYAAECGTLLFRGKTEMLTTLPEYKPTELCKTRRERKDALAEVGRLQAIVNRLPKTADGMPLHLGIRVFWSSMDPKSLTEGMVVSELKLYPDGFTAWAIDVQDHEGPMALPDDFGLYSTREAAEAASEKGDGVGSQKK